MKYHNLAISLIALILILCFSGYTAAKEISFNSESDASGDTVTISIDVDNLSGIAGGDISFSYDTSVLTALYSSAGTDAPSGLFIGNVLDPNGPGTEARKRLRKHPGSAGTVRFDL